MYLKNLPGKDFMMKNPLRIGLLVTA